MGGQKWEQQQQQEQQWKEEEPWSWCVLWLNDLTIKVHYNIQIAIYHFISFHLLNSRYFTGYFQNGENDTQFDGGYGIHTPPEDSYVG